MSERGGTTTQSGILYQNSVAALYLGRLCDPTPRTEAHTVIEVQVEASTAVDDIVATHLDGHRLFIQVKENVRDSSAAWGVLWRDFAEQFQAADFQRGRDRLLLQTAEAHEEHHVLRELCFRAEASDSYLTWTERISEAQSKLLRKINSILAHHVPDNEELLSLLKHVEVGIRTLGEIERDLVPYWVPPTNRPQIELFRLIRDRVAGEARRRGSFTAENLRASLAGEGDIVFIPQPALDELREQVRACGAGLRQHKHSFGNTGRHLRRDITDSLVAWAAQASTDSGQNNVAILLDQAGMGKTVVMRDVLLALEGNGVTVLAIKADQVSGIASTEDLQSSLRLPDSAERVLRRLAASEPVVLLIDQIDALSLSLARDQKALNVVLDLVARARLILGVRVLMSCRTFDLNNDPLLKDIDSGRKFHLPELSAEEISLVVSELGIELGSLSPTTQLLLRIPLHLDLFTRAVGAHTSHGAERPAAPQPVASLQDLYSLLWSNVIRRPDPQAPPVAHREQVINLLTDVMNRCQRTSAPQSIFSEPDTQHLDAAVQWLASQRILIPTGAQSGLVQLHTEWCFLHQTFFDYCYAKRFVERGEHLFENIRDGEQGLFSRPQVIQVLSYLRGADPAAYSRELSRLLNASESEAALRFHLRDHILRWFGSLPNPTDDEWLIARRMLINPAQRARVLTVMQGNPGWFVRLKSTLEQNLARQDERTLDTETVPYIHSMLNVSQAEAVAMLRPYSGRSEQWDRRLRRAVRSIRDWKTNEAIELFEEVFRRVPASELKQYYELDDLARAHPQAGCRLIRLAFDRILDDYVAQRQEGGDGRLYFFSFTRELEALNGSTIDEALKAVAHAEPKYFLEQVFPWVERLLSLTPERDRDGRYFIPDALSSLWHGIDVVHHHLIESLVAALTTLGRTFPADFRQMAKRLEASPYTTPQRLMAHAYRAMPELYTCDALDFLVSDPKRLDLGDHEQFDTRQLVKALVPRLTDEQVSQLEAAFLSYFPIRRYIGVAGLRWRGLEQLYLLQCIPAERLTNRGVRRLREMERKFPGVRASENPSTIRGGAVGPPISADVARKLSDKAWMSAMAKYKGAVEHKDFLKGGAMQLAFVLLELVKVDPERFFRLAMKVPLDTDRSYVRAFINGLAESPAPAEMTYETVRRFAPHVGAETSRAIARSLEKRSAEGIPDDLIALLEDYLHGEAGEDEASWLREEESNSHGGRQDDFHNAPYNSYLNSVRGAAFGSLMRILDQRGTEEDRRLKWELIDFAANDDSTALRAGVIEELIPLLWDDRERALTTFERLMAGHQALLRSHYTDEFLYHGSFKNYKRMEPFIIGMMNEGGERVRQRGAELACIASISPNAFESSEAQRDAQELALRTHAGPAPWRRGAAHVYSANIIGSASDQCARELVRFLDDEDEQIRGFASDPFRVLGEEHVFSLRGYIESYAASRSLNSGLQELAEYLWKHGPIDPPWALSVIELVLGNPHVEAPEFHFAGGEELIRLVLRVYSDPLGGVALREHAMNVFDQLLARSPGPGQMVLQEFDRR
jgi:hypothetical protein